MNLYHCLNYKFMPKYNKNREEIFYCLFPKIPNYVFKFDFRIICSRFPYI